MNTLPVLHFPEFAAPLGWVRGAERAQLWLRRPSVPGAAIIVAPLVSATPLLPPPATVIELALAQEAAVQFEVVERSGPQPAQSKTGLDGVAIAVEGFIRPAGARERRVYVMYDDRRYYYGVTLLVPAARYDEVYADFTQTAESLRPFLPAPSGGRSPFDHYGE